MTPPSPKASARQAPSPAASAAADASADKPALQASDDSISCAVGRAVIENLQPAADARDWHQPGNLNELIARVNEIGRAHPALQTNDRLAFHETENPTFLWFSKTAGTDRVFVVANTDPHWMQHGRIQMPILELGIGPHQSYIVDDLLDETRYVWQGDWNYVKLDPAERVAHILVVRG